MWLQPLGRSIAGADPGFSEGGGAGLAGLLRNLQSQGHSHVLSRSQLSSARSA